MRQVRGWMVAAVVLAIAMLSGCTAISGPRPGPETPANDPAVIAIESAGSFGKLCELIVLEGTAEDVRKAIVSAEAAQAILQEPVPSYSKLSLALREGMPPQYALISSLLLSQVRIQLGNGDVLPDDTTAWAMVETFVTRCRSKLGETAAVDRWWIPDLIERLAG